MFKAYFRQKFISLIAMAAVMLTPAIALAARGNPDAIPGELSQPTYEIAPMLEVMIPMRDGANMAGYVYLPQGEGPWPTVIVTTPYNALSGSGSSGYRNYVPRGYAFVARDLRGRYASEGSFDVADDFVGTEIYDQYDFIDWVARQPWSNGKVAVEGASMYGLTTLFAMASGHPNLVCAIPAVTTDNVWSEWHYRGGAFEVGFMTRWGLNSLIEPDAKRNLNADDYAEFTDLLALYNADRTSFDTVIPLYDFEPSQSNPANNMLQTWLDHPSYDLYWASNSAATYLDSLNVPVMWHGAWHDLFSNGIIRGYQTAQVRAHTLFARDNQYLFMHPGTHMWAQGEYDDLIAYSGEAVRNMPVLTMRIGFLDYWMKDTITPEFDAAVPVRYYTLGKDPGWQTASAWPIPEAVNTPFYFSGSKSGSIESLNDGSLSIATPTGNTAPQTYVYDPMNPIAAVGGASLYPFAYDDYGTELSGPLDQTEVDVRSLTYTGAPLEEDMLISGKVLGILHAASDAVDTDWVVRLNDVAPDGTSTLVADGILRARYRSSSTTPSLIEPGKIYEYEIDMWSTSYRFAAGHQVRVTVNSSAYGRWSRNMNVAEQPEKATDWVVANNTIYLDAEHPSHVILPVVSK